MSEKEKKEINDLMRSFSGFDNPNTTQTPDLIFDLLIAKLTGAELKVLLYIVRRTYGFGKPQGDQVSIDQICNGIVKKNGERLDYGTRLSRRQAQRAIKVLEDLNCLNVIRSNTRKGGSAINYYSLRHSDKNDIGRASLLRPRGDTHDHTPASPVTPTINSKQQTVNKTVTGGLGKQLRALPDNDLPVDQVMLIAEDNATKLKDMDALQLHTLIAAKLPERLLRKWCSEIMTDGADNPGAVFTSRVKKYAEDELKKLKGRIGKR